MKWMWFIMENNKQNNESKAKKQPKVREKLGSTVYCKHCGKPFTKKHAIEYYCSDECRHEVEKAQWIIRTKRYRARKKQQKLEQAQLEQMEQLEQDTTTDTADGTKRYSRYSS